MAVSLASLAIIGAVASAWLIFHSGETVSSLSSPETANASTAVLQPGDTPPSVDPATANGGARLPLWNVGGITGTCAVSINDKVVMQGACSGLSKNKSIVLTAERDGCTLELAPHGTDEADISIYPYRNTCWIDEQEGVALEAVQSLGVVKGQDGCWHNGDVTVCYASTKLTELPGATDTRPRLTIRYLTGQWEDPTNPSCGTDMALTYKADGTWEQNGDGSPIKIRGNGRILFSSGEGDSFEDIRIVNANSYLGKEQGYPGWILMRRCGGGKDEQR